jgi:transcriptional/translational regulatory protein YebC/TACO1
MRQPAPSARSVDPASQHVRYEGYGPAGVAVLLECATRDPQTMRGRLRGLFADHGGHLGAAGSIAYLFNEVGLLSFAAGTPQTLLGAALDAGAEDVIGARDGSTEVLTDPRDLEAVRAALAHAGYEPTEAARTWRAATSVELDPSHGAALLRLLEGLERLDDVQGIYTNAAIPDESLESV